MVHAKLAESLNRLARYERRIYARRKRGFERLAWLPRVIARIRVKVDRGNDKQTSMCHDQFPRRVCVGRLRESQLQEGVVAGKGDRPDMARRRAQWTKYQGHVEAEQLIPAGEVFLLNRVLTGNIAARMRLEEASCQRFRACQLACMSADLAASIEEVQVLREQAILGVRSGLSAMAG